MSPRVYRNIDEIFAGDCEGLTPEAGVAKVMTTDETYHVLAHSLTAFARTNPSAARTDTVCSFKTYHMPVLSPSVHR